VRPLAQVRHRPCHPFPPAAGHSGPAEGLAAGHTAAFVAVLVVCFSQALRTAGLGRPAVLISQFSKGVDQGPERSLCAVADGRHGCGQR